MIIYIDTSTLLKLMVEEDESERASVIWQSAGSVASVSLVQVEAHAALASARRRGRLTPAQFQTAKAELASLVDDLHVIPVTEVVIDGASELAESESLRGYDAVHLAAALFVGATVFSSADGALCEAAARQGFHVANLLDF